MACYYHKVVNLFPEIRSQDLLTVRRLRYARVIYFLCALFIPFYFYRFNVLYRVSDYNTPIVALFLLFAIAPLIYKKTGSFLYGAALVFFPPALILIILIYAAGGNSAPGTFWLMALPVTGGILFGKNGTILAGLLTFLTLVVFFLMDRYDLNPTLVLSKFDWNNQKTINLFTFMLYSFVTAWHFLNHEAEANQKLDAQKQEIERLLRILIHDLGNPMSVITLSLSQFKNDIGSEKSARFMLNAEKAARRIADILEHVGRFKALNDEKLSFSMDPVDLTTSVRRVVDQQRTCADEKNIHLYLHGPSESVFVLGDSFWFETVILTNLVTNAIKFSRFGQKIDLKLRVVESSVIMEVQDEGIGIPTNILKNIFSISCQTTRNGTNGEIGTGYGMPLVKECVDRMNGKIEIISSETGTPRNTPGTLVRVTFPVFRK